MATIQQLRTEAKRAGVSPSAIRSAESAAELREMIKRHSGATDGRRTAVKKSTTVKKSQPVRKTTTRTATKATGKSAPAKGRSTGTAKRQTSARATKAAAPKPRTNGYQPKGGRNVLEGVNFSVTDGWNARLGSAPDVIIKALKRFKGDREKVFNYLLPDINDFVKPKRRNGDKWTKVERENMLRYRIARTAWDFALKTGQHEKAENRVQYGTGNTGAGIWKPAKKTAAKTTARKATTTTRKATTTRQPAKKATTRTTTTRTTRTQPAAKRTTTRKTQPAKRRAVRRSR